MERAMTKTYVAAYGAIDDPYRFDNDFFGISNFDAEKWIYSRES